MTAVPSATAYRHQVLRNLTLGSLGRFLDLQRKKNALLAAHGLTPYRVWSPAFGGLYHLVLEADFPSMARFEDEHRASKALGEMAELNAAQLDLVIEGTAHDRLQRLSLAADLDTP
ncbi:hypothetical protein [Streptomyces shenzhenensis]|uniref:hypothetical protein n=1 Tax=Streptomyces shenzhenensis TaxID=943815 RepID=UPI0036B01714